VLIRSLILENFRQYRGKQQLELPADYGSDRNIIIIGGLNGAGKTSILEALRLTLFGKLNEDLWRHNSYKAYIRQCMNKQAALDGKREFHLAVELEVGDVQSSTTLRIERRWRFSDQMELASEALTLYSNDKEKLGLSQDEAELYIQERIPFGVSQFVFFDGEKIQELARDDGFTRDTHEAIYSILGLRLHQELEQDIWLYERSLLREHANSDEFRQAEQTLDRAEKQVREIQDHKADLQRELASVQQRHAAVQSERKRLGDRHLRDRLEIDEVLMSLKSQRDAIQHGLVNLVSHDLPLLLLSPILTRLRRRLETEAKVEQGQLVRSLLRDMRADVLEAYSRANGTSPRSLETALEEVLVAPETDQPLLYRHLSIDQKYALISRITSDGSLATGQVGSLLQELDTVDHKIRKVLQDKRTLPTDAEQLELEGQERDLMDQIKSLSAELGGVAVQERQATTERAAAKRSYDMAERRAELSREIQAKVEKARHIRETIATFIRSLAVEKAADVERFLSRMFRDLARKDEFVQEFVINPHTFAVEIKDTSGNMVELQTLSAGEKEIFAISLLWALGKSAVRELPMVIDTPLGRLDSVHRSHIAQHFFPVANRQVIVLSTDTEIDQSLYGSLTPFVAATFHLEYDPRQQATTIKPGYFFKAEEAKHVS